MSRDLAMAFSFWIFSGSLLAQAATSPLPSASPQPSSEPHTIALTIPAGTSLQTALDKEVRVRKVGEPITGRVMQPVYVFDHLVIPVGAVAIGKISKIDAVPSKTKPSRRSSLCSTRTLLFR